MTTGAPQNEAGASFGKYTLIAKLATGGMGEIFLARLSGMAGFEKLVVIKRLLPHLAEDAHFVAMLLDEARIAARLSHPNVCQVYDLGEVEGQYYIAMEYLEGVPSSQMLQRARREGERLDVRLGSAMLVQACEGLHHAHELKDKNGADIGLVHRDVSPSNLFLTTAGILKVLDFGVAKSQDALARTHTGALKGKYAYMSPEQVLTNPIDRRSDIFSLGIVFWEMLTTRRLFWRDSEYKMFQAIAEDEIPSVLDFRPDVPPGLAAIVDRALDRDPERRFSTAMEMAEAIHGVAAEFGGLVAGSTISDYIQRNFDQQLEERRELVHTAVSSHSGDTALDRLMRREKEGGSEDSSDFGLPGEPEPETRAEPVASAATGKSDGLMVDELIADVSRRRSSPWGWIALIVLLLAATGGGAFAFLHFRQSEGDMPPVVVYEGEVEPDHPGARGAEAPKEPPKKPVNAANAEPDAGAESPESPESPDRSRDDRRRPRNRKKSRKKDPIAAALQPRIRSCLNEHAERISGTPRVSVSFKIGDRGFPVSPKLSNGKLASLPIGKCILTAVKKTRFDKDYAGSQVKIPFRIVSRKRGG